MICLDVGDVRVGVAAADGLGLTAQGLTTITRTGGVEDYDKVIGVMRERNSSRLVVGMPKNMDGSVGPQGDKVRAFADALLERINELGLDEPELIYWDERLSTVAATKTLIDADLSRKKRKGVVDKLAAVIILQGYLDREYSKKKAEGQENDRRQKFQ